jgi:hypothetical protein
MSEELEAINSATTIARESIEQGQPMPLGEHSALLVADCCEIIGEGFAASKEWKKCSTAHRMACWFYKKALA